MTLFAWVRLLLRWLVAGAVLCLPGRGLGQGAAPPATVTGVLAEMAGRAGVIFTGQVVEIARADGFVDVRFRVATAVKGVSSRTASGNFYVLREWAGLWTGGDRYRVGQRLLMLLTARGASGMSAPVDGMDGAIPLAGGGEVPLVRGESEAPADTTLAEAETLVDLRWLAAKALRTTEALATAGEGASRLVSAARAQGATAMARPSEEPVMELPPVVHEPDGGSTAIARPVMGGTAELGWAGPVAPLAGKQTGGAAGSAATGTKLRAVLAILADGAGHAGR